MADSNGERQQVYPPCLFCGRTDIAPDEDCPWGCALRNPPPAQPYTIDTLLTLRPGWWFSI